MNDYLTKFLNAFKTNLLISKTVFIFMFIGFLLSELLIELGYIKRLWFLGKLVSYANLPPVCGSAFLLAFASPSSANAMLQSFRERGLLSDGEVLAASLLNSAAVPIYEMFTVYLPVTIPLLGIKLGLMYISVIALTSIATVAVAIAIGRACSRKRGDQFTPVAIQHVLSEERRWGVAVKKAFSKSLRRFAKVSASLIVAIVAISILMCLGAMDTLKNSLHPLATYARIPPELLPAIATYVVHPITGQAMVGQLVKSGVVDEWNAFRGLIVGSIVMVPILYIRFYIPQWISIFGLRLGLARGLLGMALVLSVRVLLLLVLV